jgi:predicted transcriptional regulator
VTAKTLLEPKLDARDSKRATGRPMKAPQRGKRAPLSLLVRPEIKRLVDKLATANGFTQSAQAEFLIAQGLNIQRVLDAMGKTLEEIERGNADAALRRRGYSHHRIVIGDKAWSFWTQPGFPIPTSGFKPWREGELKAAFPDHEDDVPDPVELPPLPPDLAESDPDRLYLVRVRGVGWKWEIAPPQVGQSSSPERETK